MSDRGPFVRVLLAGALLCGGVLAVAGGLAVRGPGLIGVGLAAALAGCTAAGIVRESSPPRRASTLESAVCVAGSTGCALLVVAGIATLAGGPVAAIAVGAGLAVFLTARVLRGRSSSTRHRQATSPATGPSWPVGGEALRLPASAEKLRQLSTRALGEEWLRTTAALAGPLDPAFRQSLVGRREAALDELERRDALGFARWLAAGPTRGSNPADYVRGGPAHQGPVADTDAA